jgi:hypothetical protein
VLGKPPAREMTSGRSDNAIRSRIAEETMLDAREAKRRS